MVFFLEGGGEAPLRIEKKKKINNIILKFVLFVFCLIKKQ